MVMLYYGDYDAGVVVIPCYGIWWWCML